MLQTLADRGELKLVVQPENKGKGAAIAAGFKRVSGDYVVIQDADLEYHPRDIPQLLAPLKDGQADVVYDSRFQQGLRPSGCSFQNYWANRFLTWLSNQVNGLQLTDMETCYQAFHSPVLQLFTLQEKRFGIEPEITAKLAKLRCRTVEIEASYSGRSIAQGKKLGLKMGFELFGVYFVMGGFKIE